MNKVLALLLFSSAVSAQAQDTVVDYTVPCEHDGNAQSCEMKVTIKKPENQIDPSNPEVNPTPTPSPDPGTRPPTKADWTMPTEPGQQCDISYRRLTQTDTHAVYEAYFGQSTYKFKDWTFPADRSALIWPLANSDKEEFKSLTRTYGAVNQWKRPSEYLNGQKAELFGTGRVQANAGKQRSLGDCWFLATSAGLAEWPERLKKVFLTQERYVPDSGIVKFQFYYMGEPVVFNIDDRLAIIQKPGYYPRFPNVAPQTNGAWWQPLIEKAYAKYNGYYAAMDGGWNLEAAHVMTGMPGKIYSSKSLTADKIWNLVKEGDGQEFLMGAGCCNAGVNTYKITGGHAYSLIKAVEVKDKVGRKHRLLHIRDPWGTEKYNGPWHDKDENWTPQLTTQAESTGDAVDGFFYVPVEQFIKIFDMFSIIYYRDQWKTSRVAMNARSGEFSKQIQFKNPIAQDVVIQIEARNDRTVPSGCAKAGSQYLVKLYKTKRDADRGYNRVAYLWTYAPMNFGAMKQPSLPAGNYYLQISQNKEGAREHKYVVQTFCRLQDCQIFDNTESNNDDTVTPTPSDPSTPVARTLQEKVDAALTGEVSTLEGSGRKLTYKLSEKTIYIKIDGSGTDELKFDAYFKPTTTYQNAYGYKQLSWATQASIYSYFNRAFGTNFLIQASCPKEITTCFFMMPNVMKAGVKLGWID